MPADWVPLTVSRSDNSFPVSYPDTQEASKEMKKKPKNLVKVG